LQGERELLIPFALQRSRLFSFPFALQRSRLFSPPLDLRQHAHYRHHSMLTRQTSMLSYYYRLPASGDGGKR